jgi:hypothetical protein
VTTQRPTRASRRVGLRVRLFRRHGAPRRTAAAALTLALVVALVAAGTSVLRAVNRFAAAGAGGVRAAGAVTSAPEGCALPDPGVVRPEDSVASRIPPEDAPTALDRTAAGVDVRGVVDDVRGLTRGARTVGTWVLPTTGVVVEVLSDGDVSVDPMAFDDLLVAAVTPVPSMRDVRAVALLRCLRTLVVDQRILAGSRLRVFVPADPRTCFLTGRLVDVDDGCDALGVALPSVDVRLRAFGRPVGGLAAPATIVVAAGTDEDLDTAARRLASVLLHELYHHVENVAGLLPWRGPLQAYEQRATYVQRAAVAQAGDRLPLPLRLGPR